MIAKTKPGGGDWYEQKWGNRRAQKAEERRVEKRAGKGGVEASTEDVARDPASEQGVVTEVRGDGHCVVALGERIFETTVPARAVVGDFVELQLSTLRRTIKRILPRQTKLVRMRGDSTRRSTHGNEEHVLAANVDIAVIVASAMDPPFHPRLVDRYLIMCQYGKIEPLIFMNKIDLVASAPDLSMYTHLDVTVVKGSASTGEGLIELREALVDKTAVLTGQSGVGKSTILNHLLSHVVQRVGGLSKSARGRHTTTSSVMHRLGSHSFLIDTPGIRSLGLWNIERRDLRLYFPEFRLVSENCKYRDCSHTHEPGCAVREAVAQGAISDSRYESYVRLMNE